MNLKTNTSLLPGIFGGTYESIWDIVEYDDDGNELMTEYDFNDLMESIAHEYQNHSGEIMETISCPFIKTITFDGTYYNPREYNFATDSLDMTIEINDKLMIETAKSLIGNPKYEEFLKTNFSSRDGFISFTPDNGWEILAEIQNNGSEMTQSISALIRYTSDYLRDGTDYNSGIEYSIYEDWSGNRYGEIPYEVIKDE